MVDLRDIGIDILISSFSYYILWRTIALALYTRYNNQKIQTRFIRYRNIQLQNRTDLSRTPMMRRQSNFKTLRLKIAWSLGIVTQMYGYIPYFWCMQSNTIVFFKMHCVEDLMTIFFPNRPEAQLNSWRLGGRESLVIGKKTRAFYRV